MKCEIPSFDEWYWKNRKELYKKGLNKKDDMREIELMYGTYSGNIELSCLRESMDEIKRVETLTSDLVKVADLAQREYTVGIISKKERDEKVQEVISIIDKISQNLDEIYSKI